MKDFSKFPIEIQRIARQQHANDIEFLYKNSDWSAYSIGWVESDGTPFPTGLPVIYQLFNNGRIVELDGDKALDFIKKYLNDE